MLKLLMVTLTVVLWFSFPLYAQENIFSGFGNVSNEEIALKQCSFDPEAEAVILIHEAISDYNDNSHLITKHHIRIKILTENGIDAANIKIPYWAKDEFELIYNVKGFTINANGTGRIDKEKLDKSAIYFQKISENRGTVSLAFAAVKVGSIIDYTYESDMKHYGGLDEWVFQHEYPVIMSKYLLNILPNTEFAYRVNKRVDIPVIIKPGNEDGRIYFEMNNIPGLSEEPFMDARRDYLQKVIFQLSGFNGRGFNKQEYMQSWNAVIRELDTDTYFGNQVDKRIPGAGELIRQTDNLGEEKKIKMIYDHVRKNFSWNHVYSKYAIDGVKSAWNKKSGSSGELNLLLVNLLKDAGLDVYPVLVSERFHGKVNTDYPFIDQFNTVFACVISGNKKYYLDATDQFTPAHIIPYDILNTTALIVDRKKGGIVSITNDSLQYFESVRTLINVKNDGSFAGSVNVTSNDYAKIMRVNKYAVNKENYMQSYFNKEETMLSLGELEMLNRNTDSLPLLEQCQFTGNANETGDYLYIPCDMFSGFDKNPLTSKDRFSNINFGFKRKIGLATSIIYPENYKAADLPKNIKFINEEQDIIISRRVEHDAENRVIHIKIEIEFQKGLYNADQYMVVKEMYKKMYTVLKEPMVLKRKA